MTDCSQWDSWESRDGTTIEKLRKCIDDDISELFLKCYSYVHDYNMLEVSQHHTGTLDNHNSLLTYKTGEGHVFMHEDPVPRYFMYGVPVAVRDIINSTTHTGYNTVVYDMYNRDNYTSPSTFNFRDTPVAKVLDESATMQPGELFEAVMQDRTETLNSIIDKHNQINVKLAKFIDCLETVDVHASDALTIYMQPRESIVETRQLAMFPQNRRIYVYYIFYKWLYTIFKRQLTKQTVYHVNTSLPLMADFISIVYSHKFDENPMKRYCGDSPINYLAYRFFQWQRLAANYPFNGLGAVPDPNIFGDDPYETSEEAQRRKEAIKQKLKRLAQPREGENEDSVGFRNSLVDIIRKYVEPFAVIQTIRTDDKLVVSKESTINFQDAQRKWVDYSATYSINIMRDSEFGRRRRTRPAVTRMIY